MIPFPKLLLSLSCYLLCCLYAHSHVYANDYLACRLNSSFLSLEAFQSDTAKKAVEINLITTGEVVLQGKNVERLSHQVPLGGRNKKEKMVWMLETEKGTAFISGEDKKGQSHQKLSIDMPKKHNVMLHHLKGALSLNGIQGSVKGVVEEGAISLTDMQGDMELFTAKGDVSLKAVSGQANIGTHQGNVLLENVDGSVYGFTHQGKVTRKITADYYKTRKKEKLEIASQQEDLLVESAPEGALLSTTKGSIEVKDAKKSLWAHTLEGNLTLKAEGQLVAYSGKGNISATYSGKLQKAEEQIEITTEQGDITLFLPATLSCEIMIEQLQNTPGKDSYKIESEFDLGEIEKKDYYNEKGELVSYQHTVYKKIGKGTCQVRLRAVNGNIYLKKAN